MIAHPSKEPLRLVQKPLAERIIEAAAEVGGCTVEEIKGPLHHRCYAHPRQAAMFVMREQSPGNCIESPWSLPLIGRRLGNRNHATVLHAVRLIEGEIRDGRTGEGTRPWLVAKIKERVGL